MRKAVYKYPLKLTDIQELVLPAGSQILSVQEQHGEVCLWALVDTSREPQRRYIAIHGTGHGVYDGALIYITTFQMHGGKLVWHVFECFPASGSDVNNG